MFFLYSFLTIAIIIIIIVKKSFFNKKKSIHIVFTGSIATGKTTMIGKFSKFLTNKGYKFYISTEIPLRKPEKLKWLYQDVEKNSFGFQIYLIIEYIKEMIDIKNKKNIDIFIYDRSIIDVLLFSTKNISDFNNLKIINDLIDDNCLNVNFDQVVFLNPSLENMLEWKRKRNRKEEYNVSDDYLKDIYYVFNNNCINFYKKFTTNDIFEVNNYNIDLYEDLIFKPLIDKFL